MQLQRIDRPGAPVEVLRKGRVGIPFPVHREGQIPDSELSARVSKRVVETRRKFLFQGSADEPGNLDRAHTTSSNSIPEVPIRSRMSRGSTIQPWLAMPESCRLSPWIRNPPRPCMPSTSQGV